MTHNGLRNEGQAADGRGDRQIDVAQYNIHLSVYVCAYKFQARLLISASESSDSGEGAASRWAPTMLQLCGSC